MADGFTGVFRTFIGLFAYFAPVPGRLPRARRSANHEKGERGALAFKEGLLKFLGASGDSDHGDQRNDFISSLLLRGQDDRPLVPIYGRQELLAVSRLIPDAKLARLHWDKNGEQLRSAHASEPAAYADVTLDDCQFGKHLEWYLARAMTKGRS